MQIELPDERISRLRQRAASAPGASEADVIREALNSLDWHDAERSAIQEGIDAWKAGRVRPFDDFDRDFRLANGIAAAD